jgi:hypothetical protein
MRSPTNRGERQHHLRRIRKQRWILHFALYWMDHDSCSWCHKPGLIDQGLDPCRCSKRVKGRPRQDRVMCDLGKRERIYKWRREALEIERGICLGRMDPEGDWVG